MTNHITTAEAIQLIEMTMKIRTYIDKIHELSYKDDETTTLVLFYLAEIEDLSARTRKAIEEA